MPCCTICSPLPTSACASWHAPRVPCWIAFIIIRPEALCLFIYNGMVGDNYFLADGADWWAFYMVALSGTLLVVYQICAAKHDFISSRTSECGRVFQGF